MEVPKQVYYLFMFLLFPGNTVLLSWLSASTRCIAFLLLASLDSEKALSLRVDAAMSKE